MANSTPEVDRLADNFFRHESGRVVSLLVKSLGVEHLQLAEDVVQEALGRALRTWPFYGIPENPAGWITQTAKNLALDAVRRDQIFRRKQIDMFGSLHRWTAQVAESDFEGFGQQVEDAVLRLMFVCCHPVVPKNSQHILALKTLCGFGVSEIARALFLTDAAVTKRLTRAKEKLAAEGVSSDLPVGERMDDRLSGVLRTLYLLFSEGYKSSAGGSLIREDLCAEALRLASVLVELPAGNRPRTHALLALMLFNSARLGTRVDARGELLLLKDQDRSHWNFRMIEVGLGHLSDSASGDQLDSVHLQAAIAAVHCVAGDYESTDWLRILSLYDLLLSIDPSPIVALNRSIAVSEVKGPRAGLDSLDRIQDARLLESYHLYYAVRADFELKLGHHEAAAALFEQAIPLAPSTSERGLLESRRSKASQFTR